jgi:Fur family ferric uptake transcriptional regulator
LPKPRSRSTRQRRALSEVFSHVGRPLSAQEAYEQARELVPSLGIATAYRAINQLVDEGRLESVELPGQPMRYELPDQPHHHHFHCRGCGQVFCVPVKCSKLDAVMPEGFAVEQHEVIFYGQCPTCSASPK